MARFTLKQERSGKKAEQRAKHTPQHGFYFLLWATETVPVVFHSGAQCGGPRSPWTGGGSRRWGGRRPSGPGSPGGHTAGSHLELRQEPAPPPAPALRRPSGPGGRAQKAPRRWCVPNAAPSRGICAGKHTSLGATFTILLRAGLAGLGADS